MVNCSFWRNYHRQWRPHPVDVLCRFRLRADALPFPFRTLNIVKMMDVQKFSINRDYHNLYAYIYIYLS